LASTGSEGLVDRIVATLSESVADFVVTHRVRQRQRTAGPATEGQAAILRPPGFV
jgi:hypothetical protein